MLGSRPLNSLKRSRAVGVSPRPGFTTSLQEVVLDRNIRLVDSPGIVFDDDDDVVGAGAIYGILWIVIQSRTHCRQYKVY